MAVTTATLPSAIAQTGGRPARWQAVRARPLAVMGGLVLLAWLAVILLAPQFATHDPLKQNLAARLSPPSRENLFGTDKLGRDLYSRVVYGARVSIPVGLMVIALAAALGTALGALAGFSGGVLDEALMRVTDVFLAFPPIILALAIAAALGPDLKNAMLALVAVWWPSYARMMRGVTLSTKQQEYVQAAVALGAPRGRILLRTILPNAFMPLLVLATVDVGSGVTAAAALSYLGLGVQPPTPEWGALVADGAEALDQWWLATFPGLAILTVVLAFNLVGDAVQELLDPRLRGA
ncbi:MAG: ABC transporter permease [Thermomicrobiales bacterium]